MGRLGPTEAPPLSLRSAGAPQSREIIDLRNARPGHPIAPGTIGENLTISGIDWSLMVPEALLEVGEVGDAIALRT